MYMEASAPSKEGEKALLSSPVFNVTEPSCARIFYHMSGADTGSLNIYL